MPLIGTEVLGLRVYLVGVLMLITLFGIACGSTEQSQGSSSQEEGDNESNTASEDTNTQTTQQPESETPSQQTLKVGDTATFRYGDTTTVYSYTYPAQSSNELWIPAPGTQYAAIDVEGCAGPVEVTGPEGNTVMEFNGFMFALQMPDNTRIPPTVPAVEPVLPAANLPAGECVRGNVTFEVPQGQAPNYVVTEPATPPTRWSIG